MHDVGPANWTLKVDQEGYVKYLAKPPNYDIPQLAIELSFTLTYTLSA